MKDDKKKLMIVGILFVVILGVGVFQFTAGSAPAPAAQAVTPENAEKVYKEAGLDEKAKEVEAELKGEGDPMQKLYAMGMPARDPFQQTAANLAPKPEPAKAQPQPQPQAPRSARRSGGGNGVTLPPFSPMQGSLPNVNVNPNGAGLPNVPNLVPEPGYTVSGVIRGPKNQAVITDSQGNQRLVTEGQSLDGDTKVVAIRDGAVVVQRKGKKETLNVGGNP